MQSLLEIVRKSAAFLAQRGVEQPRLNAEWLVAHALGLRRMDLYLQFERPLTEPELARIRPLVRRRAQREPLAHILGTAEFAGLMLRTDRRALIPRPETEELVERLVATLRPPPLRALDLGTGSGAIALALARAWPDCRVTALDRSTDALALARENAALAGLADRVELLLSDWWAAVPAEPIFDLIVSNPPYLSAAELSTAEPEVREFEPHAALVAERDGRAALETILAGAPARLAPGGWLALETGPDQHPALLAAAEAAGFAHRESVPDLSGRPRFLLLRLQPPPGSAVCAEPNRRAPSAGAARPHLPG